MKLLIESKYEKIIARAHAGGPFKAYSQFEFSYSLFSFGIVHSRRLPLGFTQNCLVDFHDVCVLLDIELFILSTLENVLKIRRQIFRKDFPLQTKYLHSEIQNLTFVTFDCFIYEFWADYSSNGTCELEVTNGVWNSVWSDDSFADTLINLLDASDD